MGLEELIEAGDIGHKMLVGGNATFGKLGSSMPAAEVSPVGASLI